MYVTQMAKICRTRKLWGWPLLLTAESYSYVHKDMTRVTSGKKLEMKIISKFLCLSFPILCTVITTRALCLYQYLNNNFFPFLYYLQKLCLNFSIYHLHQHLYWTTVCAQKIERIRFTNLLNTKDYFNTQLLIPFNNNERKH